MLIENRCCKMQRWARLTDRHFRGAWGKSKGGLTNGGLSPKFSEKIGGKSFLENRAFSGQIGAISGLVGAFSGPIGTNSSAPHSHGGRAEIAPKGPFLARLAPFGLSPPLLSPRLDFPDPSERKIYLLETLGPVAPNRVAPYSLSSLQETIIFINNRLWESSSCRISPKLQWP